MAMLTGEDLIHDIDSCDVPRGQPAIWWLGQHSFAIKAGAKVINRAAYKMSGAASESIHAVIVHALAGSAGSIYYDPMRPMRTTPGALNARVGSGSVTIMWLSEGATTYQVVYRDELAAASWTPIGAFIPGDGTVMSVTYPVSDGNRFYSVLPQ